MILVENWLVIRIIIYFCSQNELSFIDFHFQYVIMILEGKAPDESMCIKLKNILEWSGAVLY